RGLDAAPRAAPEKNSLSRSGWRTLTVEPAPHKAEQPLRHKDDHRYEDDPNRNEVVLRQKPRQTLAEQQKERGPDDRPHWRADATDHIVNDRLARDQEEDEIRRGEAVLDGVEHAGQPGEQP